MLRAVPCLALATVSACLTDFLYNFHSSVGTKAHNKATKDINSRAHLHKVCTNSWGKQCNRLLWGRHHHKILTISGNESSISPHAHKASFHLSGILLHTDTSPPLSSVTLMLNRQIINDGEETWPLLLECILSSAACITAGTHRWPTQHG